MPRAISARSRKASRVSVKGCWRTPWAASEILCDLIWRCRETLRRQPGQELLRRPAIHRQPKPLLLLPHGLARAGAQHAVDLADIIAAPFEQRLQRLHF